MEARVEAAVVEGAAARFVTEAGDGEVIEW